MTERQRQILLHLIEEYLDSASEVGSSTLASKYELGASPATIRNEMVMLSKKGYLEKSHASAGRIPTPLALRKFVEELVSEENIDHVDSVRTKQNISTHRHSRERFIREAVQELVSLTGMTVVAVADSSVYYGGISNLVKQPEFHDHDVIERVLNVIEDYELMLKVFAVESPRSVRVVIGPEIALDAMRDCSIVYKNFEYFRGQKGTISVVGPTRMNYSRAVPAVRFVAEVMSNAVSGW